MLVTEADVREAIHKHNCITMHAHDCARDFCEAKGYPKDRWFVDAVDYDDPWMFVHLKEKQTRDPDQNTACVRMGLQWLWRTKKQKVALLHDVATATRQAAEQIDAESREKSAVMIERRIAADTDRLEELRRTEI